MQGRSQDIDVSDDYLQLNEIMDEHGLPPKWLAAAVGRGLSQVYRYLSGEATIPSVVWRVLYAHTRDLRIVRLTTGEVPVTVVDLVAEQTVFETLDAPSLKQLLTHRKQQIAVEEALLEIFADGAVDRKDAAAIAKYKKHHPVMIQTAVRLYQTVIHQYERSRR